MMSSGKGGNWLLAVDVDTWFTSIVSIGLWLDRFFFLEDHDLAGFKLERDCSKEPLLS